MVTGTPSPPGAGDGLEPVPGPGPGLGLGPDPAPDPGTGLGPDEPEPPDPLRRLSPGEGDFLRVAFSLFPMKHTLIPRQPNKQSTIFEKFMLLLNDVNLGWWMVLVG